MPRTGTINGFNFDPEVFGSYIQTKSLLNNRILASGILQYDPLIERMLGTANNVGTVPMFNSVDGESDALNDDGETDNTPTALTGNKQTFMAMARMKAWSEKTFTRYLTGVSPLTNLANNLVIPYWTNQREKDLLAVLKGVMGVSGMSTHINDMSVTSGSITDANKISLTTHLDLGQKALGDRRGEFALFICHSVVATNYRKLELLENKKFYSDILGAEISVPMIGNMIVFETDTGTVDASVANFPVYSSFMLGRGCVLTAEKKVHRPYGTDYDDETDGGVEKLYTKQAYVYHPNGFSIKADNIAKESPTRTELQTSTNWELKISDKLIPIAMIKSNG